MKLPSLLPTGVSFVWIFQLKPDFEFSVPNKSESLDAVEFIPAGSQEFSKHGYPKLTYTYRGEQ